MDRIRFIALKLAAACFLFGVVSAHADTLQNDQALYTTLNLNHTGLQPVGIARKGSSYKVLDHGYGWALIEFQKKQGGVLRAYVAAAKEAIVVPVTPVAEVGSSASSPTLVQNSATLHQSTSQPVNEPWSFGAGFYGYSYADKTYFTLSGDLRYRWATWFESIVGLDLTFGTSTAVGLRGAERVYAPVSERFLPYVHVGYRVADVENPSESQALELGAGLQVLYSQGSYFEFYVTRIIPSVFKTNAQDSWIFGGSSGIRF